MDDANDFELCDVEELPKTCLNKSSSKPCVEGCRIALVNGSQWYYPTELSTIFKIFSEINDKKYILMAGNSANGKFSNTLTTSYLTIYYYRCLSESWS